MRGLIADANVQGQVGYKRAAHRRRNRGPTSRRSSALHSIALRMSGCRRIRPTRSTSPADKGDCAHDKPK